MNTRTPRYASIFIGLAAALAYSAISIAVPPEVVLGDLLAPDYTVFYLPLIALLFTRWKRVHAALIVYYIVGAATGRFDAGLSPRSL